MKNLLCAAACIAAAWTADAQTDHPREIEKKTMTPQTQTAPDAAAISTLEARWTAALLAKDQATLGELLAPEFQLVGVRSTGVGAVHRAEWLTTAGSITFHDFETETTSVELFGDAALATVEGHWDIMFGGRPIKENFYVTDVWVRRDGRWRVVRRHSSPYQSQR
ncbi:MAG: nuclear transport factor 2 family protein [Caulobacteraceae bacterium]